jgi:hypothetical protein
MAQGSLGEIEIVQNPGLGSVMIWKFGIGYQTESGSVIPTLPLAFLVLPIVFHAPTLEAVLSTRVASGLALFASKVGENRESLLAIHARALALRTLSFQSIAMGAKVQLLSLDYSSASIRANTRKTPPLPERLRRLLTGSERFGHWCARLSLAQISSLLRVDF